MERGKRLTTHSDTTDLIDPILTRSHPYRLHHLESRNAGGFSLYSKFPVKDVGDITTPTDGSMFKAQHYSIQIKGETVQVVNVHLRPPVSLQGGGSPFSMLETSPIRLEEVKNILSHVSRSPNRFVIAGDFNENDGMPALAHLCCGDLGCEDALGLSEQYTHWWKLQSSPALGDYIVNKRLDHVVTSKGLVPLDCRVLDSLPLQGSDHYCVLAKIAIVSQTE